jgi:hypothetical protein
MYSDACCNFKCQEPLVLRNVHTGDEDELLCWDWPNESEEQVATLKDGTRIAGSTLAQHWAVKSCQCGEAHPAERWPVPASALTLRNSFAARQKPY